MFLFPVLDPIIVTVSLWYDTTFAIGLGVVVLLVLAKLITLLLKSIPI